MFNTSVFEEKQKEIIVPADCNVVFVSDAFAEDYVGGAELTTKAIIDSAPEHVKVFKIHSSNVTEKTIETGYQKYWIFGNYAGLNPNLIPAFVRNCKYSIIEYDYKFCKYRSIEKHKNETGSECDCNDSPHGKIVSAFKHGAKTVYWMSEKQFRRYEERFPFLGDPAEGSRQIILSSVFSDHTFAALAELRRKASNNGKYIVLGSDSWIKGKEASIEYCKNNNLDYEVLWNIPYAEFLQKLSESAGLVYMPLGGDTCPRMVLEAQLMGKQTIVNENVQHASEFPFTGGTDEEIWDYMTGRSQHFWVNTIDDMDLFPRISGYTTTYNCESQGYPFVKSIKSMLPFCAEIVVMDGGSDDGTWETLLKLAEENKKINVYQHVVDWNKPRSAVEDGLQKARARAQCTQKYCWQQDVDEIVHEDHYAMILKLAPQFPAFVDLISLPVVEYWGDKGKVRMDVNPWKWRFSRNKPNITHGIPKHLRRQDDNGELYAEQGTDGCDYIDANTYEPIQHASFYTPEMHQLRLSAFDGDLEAKKNYEALFNNMVKKVPGVFHYSWFDLERKIKTYRGFWQRHWESLYNVKREDTAENNMFFDKPWNEVTDEDISNLATKMEKEMGGWIFHKKIDFNSPTPHLNLDVAHPEIMND
tara:strand:+ start:4714 stop:6642 length:1929 start_codon:yes stop_codon:yes gene_type:complete